MGMSKCGYIYAYLMFKARALLLLCGSTKSVATSNPICP